MMVNVNPSNPVIQLCIQGSQAEFQGHIERARACYRQAWEAARDDYDACIAAYYLARHQVDPVVSLHWNQVALEKTQSAGDARVQDFYPSLYLNLGQSHETLVNQAEAARYYALAAALGVVH
jgi:hypothetical protein